MADPNLIATSVNMGGSFKAAAKASPVMTMLVKPEIIPKIISNLGDLKGRTDDSEIVQSGNKYAFMDKRTGQPLAELDSGAGTLSMYKSPKDMAARIDSAFISAKTISTFIADSKLPDPAVSAAPATPAPAMQVASQ